MAAGTLDPHPSIIPADQVVSWAANNKVGNFELTIAHDGVETTSPGDRPTYYSDGQMWTRGGFEIWPVDVFND